MKCPSRSMASWARAIPAFTRATIISRSNSEKMPSMPNMARPAGVVVSTDCVWMYRPVPVSRMVCSTSTRCDSDRPSPVAAPHGDQIDVPPHEGLEEGIERRALVAPLGAADALVLVDLHHRVAGAFGPGLQLLALAHGVLRVSADAHVDGDALGLGHAVCSPARSDP